MEFKWGSNLDSDTLDKLAKDALDQIDTKRYDSEMTEIGVTNILKLGIAFSGKKLKQNNKSIKQISKFRRIEYPSSKII